ELATVGAGGSARGGSDLDKFAGLGQEIAETWLLDEACFDEQLEPELGFTGLFHDDAHLGDELSAGTRTAGGAIIRCHRRCRAEQLPADGLAGGRTRWRLYEMDNPHGEGFPPPTHLLGLAGVKVRFGHGAVCASASPNIQARPDIRLAPRAPILAGCPITPSAHRSITRWHRSPASTRPSRSTRPSARRATSRAPSAN